MSITINLNIEQILNNALSDDRIQPIIDKALSDAIKSAIEDATGHRSEFRDALKKQMAEIMPGGIRIDEVAKMQYMVNAAVTNAVQGENAARLQAAITEGLKHIMPDVPARIKLSDLLEAARDGFHKDDGEAFYAHYEPSNYSSGGGWLYLDGDEDCRETYRASMRLAFNSDGDVYSLKLDGRDITPKSVPDAIGRFDGLLLSLYVGRTTLEIDMDSDDVECAAQSKEY